MEAGKGRSRSFQAEGLAGWVAGSWGRAERRGVGRCEERANELSWIGPEIRYFRAKNESYRTFHPGGKPQECRADSAPCAIHVSNSCHLVA